MAFRTNVVTLHTKQSPDLQDLVPDRCRPAREPLGNSWPRRSWGAIRSVKHRVTPGCRADGCTNPVLPLRCRNQKVRNHKTIILLLKMRAVNAKLHDLCSHPRGTQASPDVLSNGSLPVAAAPTYSRAVCPSPWARFRYTSFMSPIPGSNKLGHHVMQPFSWSRTVPCLLLAPWRRAAAPSFMSGKLCWATCV